MRGIERQQLQFVRFGRPGAALASLVVFGVYELVTPSARVERLLALLLVALAVSALDVLALRRFPVGLVARVTLALDIALIALMIAVLDEPALLVAPYYAPVAFAALLFGPKETALYAVLGGIAGIVVGPFIGASTLTIVASVLVLAVTGAILAGLSAEAHKAQAQLAEERAHDAAALRISERIRSSLDLDEVLAATVEELGRATGAARALLRLAPSADGIPRVYEWDRGGVERAAGGSPPAAIQRIFSSREPLVVRHVDDADAELAAHLRSTGVGAIIAYPVVWQGRVVAAVGFHDLEPRDWSDVEPLLQRLAPQIAAALAQAELYEQQQLSVARLKEVAELRENLIANVSHELRTPLTSTLGFLQTLERPDVDLASPEARELLAVARREAERLARLVDDLLALARLDRGELPLERRRVRLAPLVEEAVATAGTDDVRAVDVEVGHDLVVDVDSDRLVQVLRNLIGNAFRHGHGVVTVRASGDGSEVELAVSDEGPGVPTENVDDLFTPFARWSTHSDSTGLGLAIARGIAEAHGGSLAYETNGDRGRHAFVLRLPAGSG